MNPTHPPTQIAYPATIPVLNMVAREEATLMLVDDETQRWSLSRRQPTTIGRSDGCEIVLLSRRISRQHARITWHGSWFVLEDLQSKNGTHLNGTLCAKPAMLQNGDVIQLGEAFQLLYLDEEATEPVKMDVSRVGLWIDHANCTVHIDGHALDQPLSPPQYHLLALLDEKINEIVSRDEIINAVWPDEMEEGITEQAIDALVRRLREHLRRLAPNQTYLETVRAHGFRLHRFPMARSGGGA